MNKLLLKKPENMTPIQLEKIYKICWDEIHKREELKDNIKNKKIG